MGEQVKLIPLLCPKCNTALPAELDEAAAIEADRKDKFKQIRLAIELSEPVLWILKE